MTGKRNPFSALVLSIVPGLGQLYNGQPLKAGIFVAIDLVVPILFGLAGFVESLNGLIVFLVFSLAFILYRLTDGFVRAKRQSNYQLKAYNKWFVYLPYILVFGVLRFFFSAPASAGIQLFTIPTPSMYPTIQPGDRIVASTSYYKRNPIQRGDIVIFNSPQGGIWTFRVVGMPNDSIEVRDGQAYINGQRNERMLTTEYVLEGREVIQYKENLSADKTIKILIHKDVRRFDEGPFSKLKVPGGEYYLMGDNRDNAFDSRHIGPIKEKDILGRVMYSYWGKTSHRFNLDFVNE